MSKETISVRVESPIRDKIREFQDEQDLSEADAVRSLIRMGFEYKSMEERMEEMEKRIEELQGQINQQNNIIASQQEELAKCRDKTIWDILIP